MRSQISTMSLFSIAMILSGSVMGADFCKSENESREQNSLYSKQIIDEYYSEIRNDISIDDIRCLFDNLSGTEVTIDKDIFISFALNNSKDTEKERFIRSGIAFYLQIGEDDEDITALCYILLSSESPRLIMSAMTWLKSHDNVRSRPFRQHFGAYALEYYRERGWDVLQEAARDLME